MEFTPQRQMIRVREVARLTGLSVSFLNKLRCSGSGPAFRKIGRAVVYDPADIENWLAQRRRVSTSDRGDHP